MEDKGHTRNFKEAQEPHTEGEKEQLNNYNLGRRSVDKLR